MRSLKAYRWCTGDDIMIHVFGKSVQGGTACVNFDTTNYVVSNGVVYSENLICTIPLKMDDDDIVRTLWEMCRAASGRHELWSVDDFVIAVAEWRSS